MLLALLLTMQAATPIPMELAQAEKLAALALACAHQEYPNKVATRWRPTLTRRCRAS